MHYLLQNQVIWFLIYWFGRILSRKNCYWSDMILICRFILYYYLYYTEFKHLRQVSYYAPLHPLTSHSNPTTATMYSWTTIISIMKSHRNISFTTWFATVQGRCMGTAGQGAPESGDPGHNMSDLSDVHKLLPSCRYAAFSHTSASNSDTSPTTHRHNNFNTILPRKAS